VVAALQRPAAAASRGDDAGSVATHVVKGPNGLVVAGHHDRNPGHVGAEVARRTIHLVRAPDELPGPAEDPLLLDA
jgi:hypothetical protein